MLFRSSSEIGVDEFLGRLFGDADVLGERERGLSVEQCVVDDLRAAAQLVRVEAAIGAAPYVLAIGTLEPRKLCRRL